MQQKQKQRCETYEEVAQRFVVGDDAVVHHHELIARVRHLKDGL